MPRRRLRSSKRSIAGRCSFSAGSYSLHLVNIPLIWLLLALSPALGLDHFGAVEHGLLIGLLVTLASLHPRIAAARRIFRMAGRARRRHPARTAAGYRPGKQIVCPTGAK
jgi:hypothetical protein